MGLLIFSRSKINMTNKIISRLKTETDQNSILKMYLNSKSYLGDNLWKKPGRGERGKKGRPPDWLSSQFTENLVSNKLDILGNVMTGEEICSDFKNKLQEIEGFTEDLYKEIFVMLKNRSRKDRKRGRTNKRRKNRRRRNSGSRIIRRD